MSPSFRPLAPTVRLADQVADALAGEIRAGRLTEGDRLPTEQALTEQFGVSRTVVREAVSRLKSLGLLASRQGSGVYVCALAMEPLRFELPHAASREAVIQMVELRRALEAEVAALAAQRRTAGDLRRIRAAIRALQKAVRSDSHGADEDLAFHRSIAEAARNPFLLDTLQYLRQFLHGAMRVTRANEARRADFAQQVAQEHAQIVNAIEAGDSEAARAAAQAHMDNAIRRIQQADSAFWQQEGDQLAQPLVASWAQKR